MPRNYDYDEDPTESATTTVQRKNYAPNPTEFKPHEAVPPKDNDEPIRRVVRGGWGNTKSSQGESTEYAVRLKLTDDVQIIKFLEDEPFAYWRQHWVERQGQKSFICLADEGDCPLCMSGMTPSWKFAFNVVLLDNNAEPALRSMEVGVRAKDQLRNFNDGPMTGPLSKHYWAVSRSGRGTTASTNFQMVRERDLDEWRMTALTDADLTHFGETSYKPSIYIKPKRSDLVKIVQEELS
jgi:hypothetical protein